jgi:hypothetical protein
MLQSYLPEHRSGVLGRRVSTGGAVPGHRAALDRSGVPPESRCWRERGRRFPAPISVGRLELDTIGSTPNQVPLAAVRQFEHGGRGLCRCDRGPVGRGRHIQGMGDGMAQLREDIHSW